MTPKTKTSADYRLLQELCAVPAPSGNEAALKSVLLNYVLKHSPGWKGKVKIIDGEGWQDNLILVFGKPRTAVFAHMDSIGFTVRYGKQLVKIGGPVCKSGFKLWGCDSKGRQEAELLVKEDKRSGEKSLAYKAKRDFERGTELLFKANWREDKHFVQCCYMDNRLGIYSALKLAEELEDGVIVFCTWEEHGGGSVSYIQRFLQKKYGIRQALVSDISWISDGVHEGKGPVISLRDSLIPRRSYVEKIINIAKKHRCAFQLEVEGSGGSDAKELQMAEYPWDWCFVGAAEQHVHSPDEKVHKKDITGMIRLYQVLMKEL
ncbi:MAG TPA: aminopeptidase [Bacteroidia bacterium]|nr:aminopeptidase [Bacteroidia bacterium]